MKTIKLFAVAMLLGAGINTAVMAQNKTEKEPVKEAKEHKCNPGCNSVKHNNLHGEKGHTCTDNCKKQTPAPAPAPKG